ncbi:MAG: LLM class flavin-dependent oxidoreductase [Actinobacteria bacterium]|nr:LLM class flavin-dependent oxidoreductase [Actinomycetota bacterium]
MATTRSLLLDSPLSIKAMGSLAGRAEKAGFDRIWIAETDGPDALVTAALVSMRTKRVQIGTSIVPSYSRTPAVLGMAADTLAGALENRPFILGIGTGGQAIVERWHGLAMVKPLKQIEESVQILRSVLAGDKTDFVGEALTSRGFRLRRQGGEGVRIFLAALGPRMLSLGSRIADGVILTLTPARHLPEVVDRIRKKVTKAGRDPDAVEIVCRAPVVVDPNEDSASERARAHLSFYLPSLPYNRYLSSLGYSEECARFLEAFSVGDRVASRAAISKRMLDDLIVQGSNEECRDRLSDYLSAGIDDLMVSPVFSDPVSSEVDVSVLKP